MKKIRVVLAAVALGVSLTAVGAVSMAPHAAANPCVFSKTAGPAGGCM